MMNADTNHQRNKGIGRRLLIATLLLPVFVIITGIFLGIRATLFSADANEVDKVIFQWGVPVLLFGILLGVFYIIAPPILSDNWQVIVISAVLGIFPVALLYPWLSEKALIFLAQPIENPLLNDPKRLILIGGMDGVIFGVVVGVLLRLVDPKTTPLNHQSLVRYLVLSTIVAGIVIGIMIINESSNVGDFIATFFAIILLPVLKVGVWWWDKRHNKTSLPNP